MPPSRCSYCGEAVATPIRLTWVVPGRPGRPPRHIKVPLCALCGQSWSRPAVSGADGRSAPRAA
jgi:hypothetical protein